MLTTCKAAFSADLVLPRVWRRLSLFVQCYPGGNTLCAGLHREAAVLSCLPAQSVKTGPTLQPESPLQPDLMVPFGCAVIFLAARCWVMETRWLCRAELLSLQL